MADLGNIGRVTNSLTHTEIRSFRQFGSQPLANVVAGSGATPLSTIILVTSFYNLIDWTVCDGGGNWTFYDLVDGTYYAIEMSGGKIWVVTITNNVPSVAERVSSGVIITVG